MSGTGRADWSQFTKRMQGVAERECLNRGFAVVSIDILVGADGEPMFWTQPRLTRLEPRIGGSLFLERILQIIGEKSKGGD